MRPKFALALTLLCCLPGWAHPKPPAALKNRVTRSFRNADLVYVIRELARAMGRNLYIGPGVEGDVSVHLRGVPPQAALAMILADAENEIAYKLVGAHTLLVAAPEKNGISCFSPRPQPGPDGLRHEFLLEHLPASELVTILERLHPKVAFKLHSTTNGFYAYGSRQDFELIAQEIEELDIEKDIPDPIEESVVVRYGKKDEILPLLATLVPDVKVTTEAENPELLHLEGTPRAIEQAKELLDQLDRPLDKAIVLECKLANLSEEQRRHLAVQWISTPWTAHEKESLCFGDRTSSVKHVVDPPQLGVFRREQSSLHFLIAQSEAHVLASPRIALASGQRGRIHVGDKFPLVYLDRRAGEFEEAYEDLGLTLSAQCTRLPDQRIRCQIQGEFTCLEELLAGCYPRLRTLTFEGQADLDDGQTLVLAGLTTPARLQAAAQAIPLLGDLPIQGPLFRDVRLDQRIYLMLTPEGP